METRLADTWIEYVEIPPGTAQEMMSFYAKTVNDAHAASRTGMSKRYKELMDVVLTSDWRMEFKEVSFVVLQWAVAKFLTKEQFFDEENTTDGSSAVENGGIEEL